MRSLILANATRYLLPLLLLFAVLLLLQGHNAPGGGFAGGLVAASAIALRMLGIGLEDTRRLLLVRPPVLIGLGLLAAAGSGIWALLAGGQFLQGQWLVLQTPPLAGIHVGTPLLFDVGVFLVTMGGMLQVLVVLEEEY